MPSMAAIAPARCRVSMPIFTFSSAVSAGKSRMFWNVRATPRWLMTWVFLPMTLTAVSPARPMSRMLPCCGVYTPVRELNSDVLPAPFGPMTARIWPRYNRIETSLRLTTPPKRSVTCSTSYTISEVGVPVAALAGRSVVVMSHALRSRHRGHLGTRRRIQPFEFGLAPSRREQAGRPEDHHRQDAGAGPHLRVVGRDLGLEDLRQPGQDRGARHGAGDRPHAAEHHVGDDEDGLLQGEQRRVEVSDLRGEEHAGEPRGRCPDRERQQLHPERVDARGLGRVLVLADRRPRPPQTRGLQPIEQHR